ncbi:hypothetical protein KC19_9G115000 [Ceratodon purpureus]|uniref:Uncharacterized protein n=1 Tax=Ceratodon purpureus TaxID=3225 RepID=A0A8T0GV90_CERPU|nr:hypothetical protein KC19_9G115000 [Ceratodon purpureus]
MVERPQTTPTIESPYCSLNGHRRISTRVHRPRVSNTEPFIYTFNTKEYTYGSSTSDHQNQVRNKTNPNQKRRNKKTFQRWCNISIAHKSQITSSLQLPTRGTKSQTV